MLISYVEHNLNKKNMGLVLVMLVIFGGLVACVIALSYASLGQWKRPT